MDKSIFYFVFYSATGAGRHRQTTVASTAAAAAEGTKLHRNLFDVREKIYAFAQRQCQSALFQARANIHTAQTRRNTSILPCWLRMRLYVFMFRLQ